jgi:hypothetical protein
VPRLADAGYVQARPRAWLAALLWRGERAERERAERERARELAEKELAS